MKRSTKEYVGRPDQMIDRRIQRSKRLQLGILGTIISVGVVGGTASTKHEYVTTDALLVDVGLLAVASGERLHAKRSTERMVERYRQERHDRQLLPLANSNQGASHQAEQQLESTGASQALITNVFAGGGAIGIGGLMEGKLTLVQGAGAGLMMLFAAANLLLQDEGANQLRDFRHAQLEAVDTVAVAQLFKS